jgi:hypothetical protein
LCLSNRSRPDEQQLPSEIVVVSVHSLYAQAIEDSKSRAALSTSLHDLNSILGDTKAEAMLWNRSKSVNFSTWYEIFFQNRDERPFGRCICRRRFFLMILGLSCVGSSCAAAPTLHDCCPCSWLNAMIPHLST